MRYWIKSCPPLVIKKSFLNTTHDLFDWMEEVIKESKVVDPETGDVFAFLQNTNMIEKCFVLLKVEDIPEADDVFRADPTSMEMVSMPNIQALYRLNRTFQALEEKAENAV